MITDLLLRSLLPDSDDFPTPTTAALGFDYEGANIYTTLTDAGNAARIAYYAVDRLASVGGKWRYFDGQRWAEDESNEALRLALDAHTRIGNEATGLDQAEAKAIFSWAKSSLSHLKLKASLGIALAHLAMRQKDFDMDGMLVNCENVTVNCETGEARKHDPLDYITKLAPVTFDPEVECFFWHSCLDKWLDGNENLIRWVQKALGYSIVADVSEQVLFFLHGSGANGKSTFLQTILSVLGDYADQAPPSLLIQKQNNGLPVEIADLRGLRFVSTVEVEQGRRFAEVLLKQLTGGDRVRARRWFENYQSFEPTWKIWLAANHRPSVRGTDHAIWRRLALIPFTVQIPQSEQDPHLLEKLRSEKSGIFNWILEGCQLWLKEGLAPWPNEVQAANDEYRTEQDILGLFLSECTIEGADVPEKAGKLYSTYKDWADSNGHKAENNTVFKEQMLARGYSHKRTKAGHFYAGLKLSESDYEQV